MTFYKEFYTHGHSVFNDMIFSEANRKLDWNVLQIKWQKQ